MGKMIRYGGVNVTDRDPRYQEIMALLQAQGLQQAQQPNPLSNDIQQQPQFTKPAMFGNGQTPAQQAVGHYPNNRFGTWYGAPSAGGFNSMGGAVWGGALPNKMPPIGQPQPSQAEVQRMFQDEWNQQRNPQKPQGNPLSNDLMSQAANTARETLQQQWNTGKPTSPIDFTQMLPSIQNGKPGFYPRIAQKKNENLTDEEIRNAWAQVTPQQRAELSDGGKVPTNIGIAPRSQSSSQQKEKPSSGGGLGGALSSYLGYEALSGALGGGSAAAAVTPTAIGGGMATIPAASAIPSGYTAVATMADGSIAVAPSAIAGEAGFLAGAAPYLGAAGALGIANLAATGRRGAAGTAQGAASGAAIGTAIMPGIGTAIGATLGAALPHIGVLGSKKSKDQQSRDAIRKGIFQKTGLADNEFQMKFADGEVFDLGKDGKEAYGKDAIDYDKYGTLVAYADQLADQMKLEGRYRSAFSAMLTKAATSGAGAEDLALAANRMKEIGGKLQLKTDFIGGGGGAPTTAVRQPAGPRKQSESKRPRREATPSVDDGQYPIMISKKPAPVVGNPFTPLKTKEDFINAIMGMK